jgi:hypothetical protein
MKYLQLLTHEIGTSCNLIHKHQGKCPITIPERYDAVDTHHALTDDEIVSNILTAYSHGFRGMTSWHSYCEPLLYLDRIEKIVAKVNEHIPQQHLLWTNGTLIEKIDPQRLKIFSKIIISNYQKKNWDFLKGIVPDLKILRGHLDDRVTKKRKTRKRCLRLFTEMIIDYYGNYRICCGDFMGTSLSLNTIKDGFDTIIHKHQELRSLISIEPQPYNVPNICKTCSILGRTYIYNLVNLPYYNTMYKLMSDHNLIIEEERFYISNYEDIK